jgi:hypothetical protein
LSDDNVGENRFFYSTNPATTPEETKFRKKKMFESKIMIWLAISARGVSDVYIHREKQPVRQDIYLPQCIDKRLLPCIEKHHANGNFLVWLDLAAAHYSHGVQQRLTEKNVPFVLRKRNPPNVRQACPIEKGLEKCGEKVYMQFSKYNAAIYFSCSFN